MQAIVTKFIPCTNFRGSRIKATAAAGSVTLNWDHALDPDGNHRAAAKALVEKYGWHGRWVGGGLPDGSSVWVNATVGPWDDEAFTVEQAGLLTGATD